MEFDSEKLFLHHNIPQVNLVVRTFPFALGLGGKGAGNEINPLI